MLTAQATWVLQREQVLVDNIIQSRSYAKMTDQRPAYARFVHPVLPPPSRPMVLAVVEVDPHDRIPRRRLSCPPVIDHMHDGAASTAKRTWFVMAFIAQV